jgi:hypothetical protein
MSWEHLCSGFILSLRAIEWWRKGVLLKAKPCIYTQYCRIGGNARDPLESLARPLGDLWDFPSVPKSLCGFQWVVLTHRKLFLATWRSQSQARGQVATRTMFQTKHFWIWKVSWNSAKPFPMCSQCVPLWIRKVSWDSARLQFWWPCSGVN